MRKVMKLNRKQFDVLVTLLDNKGISQREVCNKTNYSLGTINNVIKELLDEGLIKDNIVTSKGLEELEPYKVKRAIFIAAGFGSRMVPVTLNTPKPLVRVNGTRIIDTLLDGVIEAGIEEIIIVRGYLSEQFDQLLYKYPNIKFIENPAYNDANNISSTMCVRYDLENAYILEADLLLSNKKLIKKYNYCSNFLGIKMDRSDDWCFDVKNNIITSQKVGGENVYQEVGISYWDKEDGKKLAEDIKKTYDMPGGHERYWDQVPFVFFPKNYNVEIRECKKEDIIEIDTYKELQSIDKTYVIK